MLFGPHSHVDGAAAVRRCWPPPTCLLCSRFIHAFCALLSIPHSDEGYFLEVLASPLTCFNASNYGAIMIVDSEDEFYKQVGL